MGALRPTLLGIFLCLALTLAEETQDGYLTDIKPEDRVLLERFLDIADRVNIMPAKWKPGDVIKQTDAEAVNTALDDVLRAAGLLESRRCAIAIINKGPKKLVNPRWFTESGQIHTALPMEIPPKKTGLMLFVRKSWAFAGSEGVFTYDIEDTDFKIAVMWSVPKNKVLNKSYFNVKVYHKNAIHVGKKMWKQMKNIAGSWISEGWETRNEYGFKFIQSMTDHNHAKLLSFLEYNQPNVAAGPSLVKGCNKWGLKLGKFCWQECVMGSCWLDKKCKSAGDCPQGVSPCRSKC